MANIAKVRVDLVFCDDICLNEIREIAEKIKPKNLSQTFAILSRFNPTNKIAPPNKDKVIITI